MQKYKIGLLIFSNTKSEAAGVLKVFEKMVKKHEFGVVKSFEVLDHQSSQIGPCLEQYKNTNLGIIVLVAQNADGFFPFLELEETGLKNEKFLVTLNLDNNLENNFLKIIEKIKASPGKPYRGCDSSCR
jgi:hypothetical protein